MKFTKFTTVATFGLTVTSASAYTITFVNSCSYEVFPAIGKAPSGVPDTSVAFGSLLAAGASVSYTIDSTELGIRAWGRTGCDSSGEDCATGGCVGGMVCTDAGINSGVILSEFGYADFGTDYGGERTSWDLSDVDLVINIPTELVASDGQSVSCTTENCAADDVYLTSTDYSADRNSALSTDYTHTFCPSGSDTSTSSTDTSTSSSADASTTTSTFEASSSASSTSITTSLVDASSVVATSASATASSAASSASSTSSQCKRRLRRTDERRSAHRDHNAKRSHRRNALNHAH